MSNIALALIFELVVKGRNVSDSNLWNSESDGFCWIFILKSSRGQNQIWENSTALKCYWIFIS